MERIPGGGLLRRLHLELKPVLTQQAGFEWATGCFINPTAPEEAASFLRQTEVFP